MLINVIVINKKFVEASVKYDVMKVVYFFHRKSRAHLLIKFFVNLN